MTSECTPSLQEGRKSQLAVLRPHNRPLTQAQQVAALSPHTHPTHLYSALTPAHSLRRSRWLYSRRPTVRNLSSPPAASEQASQ